MGHATTTISTGLIAALTRQHTALARRWHAARSGHVKAVHRGRVASRRLREILAVMDAADAKGRAGRLGRDIRRLTRALGPVREIDVALIELDRAAMRHGWAHEVTNAIRRQLTEERDHRATRMAEKLDKLHRARVRDEVGKIEARLMNVTDRSWQTTISSRIVRRARAVLAASLATGTIYVPEQLHALRIAIKKLRYALELLPFGPGLDVQDALRVLKRAQRRFGLLHDVQVLTAQVQAIDVVGRPAADRAALIQAAEDLERDCREIHAKALATVPAVDEWARLVRRELGVRRPGRRLTMAKAALDTVSEDANLKVRG